jgi:hypothetical protein
MTYFANVEHDAASGRATTAHVDNDWPVVSL